ncbi:MAG TPA: hypothetical protein VGQ40_07310 [Chthoniobacterales bacterium]|nr:hypothetical protein [Chthoniobacterales bacterium]
MTTRTGVIAVQPDKLVEEKQTTKLGFCGIDSPAEAPFQGAFYLAGETLTNKGLPQLPV